MPFPSEGTAARMATPWATLEQSVNGPCCDVGPNQCSSATQAPRLTDVDLKNALDAVLGFDPTGAPSLPTDSRGWSNNAKADLGVEQNIMVGQVLGCDLNNWYTGSVTTMYQLFHQRSSFNANISDWDTAAVKNMHGAFKDATAFDQDLSTWNTGAVTTMHRMFYNATSFNKPLFAGVSAVTSMEGMFEGATAFNQDLSGWNTGAVTEMKRMFYGATSFNKPLFAGVSAVTSMESMFYGAAAFNQDLSGWNTGAVTQMTRMFYGATVFNQPLFIQVAGVKGMSEMFRSAVAFDQSHVSDWNTGSVTSMANMFNGASAFNQDVSRWTLCSACNSGGAPTTTDMFLGTAHLSSGNWQCTSPRDGPPASCVGTPCTSADQSLPADFSGPGNCTSTLPHRTVCAPACPIGEVYSGGVRVCQFGTLSWFPNTPSCSTPVPTPVPTPVSNATASPTMNADIQGGTAALARLVPETATEEEAAVATTVSVVVTAAVASSVVASAGVGVAAATGGAVASGTTVGIAGTSTSTGALDFSGGAYILLSAVQGMSLSAQSFNTPMPRLFEVSANELAWTNGRVNLPGDRSAPKLSENSTQSTLLRRALLQASSGEPSYFSCAEQLLNFKGFVLCSFWGQVVGALILAGFVLALHGCLWSMHSLARAHLGWSEKGEGEAVHAAGDKLDSEEDEFPTAGGGGLGNKVAPLSNAAIMSILRMKTPMRRPNQLAPLPPLKSHLHSGNGGTSGLPGDGDDLEQAAAPLPRFAKLLDHPVLRAQRLALRWKRRAGVQNHRSMGLKVLMALGGDKARGYLSLPTPEVAAFLLLIPGLAQSSSAALATYTIPGITVGTIVIIILVAFLGGSAFALAAAIHSRFVWQTFGEHWAPVLPKDRLTFVLDHAFSVTQYRGMLGVGMLYLDVMTRFLVPMLLGLFWTLCAIPEEAENLGGQTQCTAYQAASVFAVQVSHFIAFIAVRPLRSKLKLTVVCAMSGLESLAFLSILVLSTSDMMEGGSGSSSGGFGLAVIKGLVVLCALAYAIAASGPLMILFEGAAALSNKVDAAIQKARKQSDGISKLEKEGLLSKAKGGAQDQSRLEDAQMSLHSGIEHVRDEQVQYHAEVLREHEAMPSHDGLTEAGSEDLHNVTEGSFNEVRRHLHHDHEGGHHDAEDIHRESEALNHSLEELHRAAGED